MDTPTNKIELIDQMTAGRTAWDILLSQIPDERFREPGVDGIWSVKEILAHVCAFEQYMVAMIQDMKETSGSATAMLDSYYQMQLAMYRTEHPEIPEHLQDVHGEQVNEVFAASFRYKRASEVRSMEADTYRKLFMLVERLSEAELNAPFANTGRTLLQILPRQCYAHYLQHIPAIQLWLAK